MNGSQIETEQRVTPLELFFDLVFVFAITQVTGFLSDNSTWLGLLQGLLLLGALWWAWAAYAWLTNNLNPEEGAVRLAVFASIAAMLIVALATPTAFGIDGVVFGVAYFIVRALHLVLYAIGWPRRPGADRAPSCRIAPTAMLGSGPAGRRRVSSTAPCRSALWAVGARDRLPRRPGRSRAGMARFAASISSSATGLVVIIALGRVGRRDRHRRSRACRSTPALIVAALLGITVIAALWWSYFDWVTFVAQARLVEATGPERAALARDLYSYLHLPMVAGIVLFALGLKTTIAHVSTPLPVIPAIGLCGGLALYFLAHVAARLRIGGGLGRGRPIATIVLLVLIPVAVAVPALAALGLVAAVCVALIAYEALRYRDARAWIRSRRGHFTMEEAARAGRVGNTRGGTPHQD